MSEGRDGERGSRYAILIVAVGLVAVAGYAGYALYPPFDLPAVQRVGLLGLAAAAGVASFFSPCSFPLLVTLLGRQAATDAKTGTSPRSAIFGGALALRAAVFMLLSGMVIAFGGETLFADVTFTSPAGIVIRAVVGLLLIILGLVQSGLLFLHAPSEPLLPADAQKPGSTTPGATGLGRRLVGNDRCHQPASIVSMPCNGYASRSRGRRRVMGGRRR